MKSSIALVIALCATPSLAQNILVVDAAGGPGSAYTEIQAAVVAAQPGDVIEVRPGDYSHVTIDKGVHVIGDQARITRGGISRSGIDIMNVPATQSVAVHGIRVDPNAGSGGLVWNCGGPVLLASLRVTRLTVVDSSAVQVVNMTTGDFNSSAHGVVIMASTVAFDRCTLAASLLFSRTPSSGLEARASAVSLSRCSVQGASSPFTGPGSGIVLSAGSTLTVTGPGRIAGSGGGVSIGGGGSLILDPVTNLIGAIGPAVQTTLLATPSLFASGSQLGGARMLDLRASAGAPFVLVLGVAGQQPEVFPGALGSLWIDFGMPSITYAAGVVPNNGQFTSQFQSAAGSSLFGVRFVWQAATINNGLLLFSNSSSYVLTR